MWWLYVLVIIGAIVYAWFTQPHKRIVLVAGLTIICLMIYSIESFYLSLLYSSAPKDSNGSIIWTYELADRVRDITAVLYSNSVAFTILFLLALWTLYQIIVESKWFNDRK